MKWLYLLLGLSLVGCASTPSKVALPVPETPESSYQLIGLGLVKIKEGQHQLAIEKYFEPVILHCHKLYGQSGKRVFSARSNLESSYYLFKAAAQEQEAITVDTSCSDALFYKGYANFEAGQTAAAENLILQAIEMAPANSTYQSELGYLYRSQQEWQKALASFESAEELASAYSPKHLRVRELVRAKRGRGMTLIELGHWDQAEELFKECLRLDPKDSVARNELKYIDQLRHSF